MDVALRVLDLHQPVAVGRVLLGSFEVERGGELLLNLLAEARAGVVGAERIDHAVGRGVVNHAALDALDVVVVGVHEVHAGDEQGLIGERAVALAAPLAVVGHALEGLEEALEGEARRREYWQPPLIRSSNLPWGFESREPTVGKTTTMATRYETAA